MSYRQLVDRLLVPRLASLVGPLLLRLCTPGRLQQLGDYLMVCSEPLPADAVLILGGGTRQRLDWGSELFRRGLAARIVLTSSVDPVQLAGSPEHNSFDELKRTGVPDQALTWVPWPRNTYEEAQAALDLASSLGWRRLLVVTEAFHSRRACATFARVFANSAAELSLTCPPASIARAERWWERRRDLEGVLSELLSLAYYKARGRI